MGHTTKNKLTKNESYVHTVQKNQGKHQEPRGLFRTHLVIEVVVALIHLLLPEVPLIFHVHVRVELSRLGLRKLKVTAGVTVLMRTPNTPALHEHRANPTLFQVSN